MLGKNTHFISHSVYPCKHETLKKKLALCSLFYFCFCNFNNSCFSGVICNLFIIWLGASQPCFQWTQFPAAVKKWHQEGKNCSPVGEEPWERKAKRPGRKKSCLNLPDQSEDSTWHHPTALWRPLMAIMEMLLLPSPTESFTHHSGLSG